MSMKTKLSCAAVGLFFLAGAAIGDEPASKSAAELSPECPKFAATTTEPIQLRYKAEAGRKVDWKLGLETEMDAHLPGAGDAGKMKMSTGTKIEGGYEVQSVEDGGDFTVRRTVRRMITKVSGAQDVTIDSDKPGDDGSALGKAMKPLMKVMTETPISMKMSPLGKVLEVDMKPLLETLDNAGGKALAGTLRELTRETVRNSFVPLPEEAVKAGDAYEAGKMAWKVPGRGECTVKMRYQVVAVSADKKQALLRPKGDLSLVPGKKGGVSFALESKSLDGWLLFDVEKGYVVRSRTNIKLVVKLAAAGKTAPLRVDMKVTYDATAP
jgi:hypothetical protein